MCVFRSRYEIFFGPSLGAIAPPRTPTPWIRRWNDVCQFAALPSWSWRWGFETLTATVKPLLKSVRRSVAKTISNRSGSFMGTERI